MQPLKNNVFLRAALVLMAVFCVGAIFSLQLDFNQLKNQRDELAEQIAAAEARIEELQNALETPFDNDYVIKFAREKLNYRLPEEIVFYNDLNN